MNRHQRLNQSINSSLARHRQKDPIVMANIAQWRKERDQAEAKAAEEQRRAQVRQAKNQFTHNFNPVWRA